MVVGLLLPEVVDVREAAAVVAVECLAVGLDDVITSASGVDIG